MTTRRCLHVTPEHHVVNVGFVGGRMVALEDSALIPAKVCGRKVRKGRPGVVHMFCPLHEAAGLLSEDGAELIESAYFIAEPAP
jgi:hypothetical protein